MAGRDGGFHGVCVQKTGGMVETGLGTNTRKPIALRATARSALCTVPSRVYPAGRRGAPTLANHGAAGECWRSNETYNQVSTLSRSNAIPVFAGVFATPLAVVSAEDETSGSLRFRTAERNRAPASGESVRRADAAHAGERLELDVCGRRTPSRTWITVSRSDPWKAGAECEDTTAPTPHQTLWAGISYHHGKRRRCATAEPAQPSSRPCAAEQLRACTAPSVGLKTPRPDCYLGSA